jgi:spermidine/putrescine transport system ATP-binding protein
VSSGASTDALTAGSSLAGVSATTPAQAVVRLSRVSKRFGKVVAVDEVNLEIPQGHFTTLLGPSGCGKTTLLRMLAGFEEPTTGTVEIDGRDMRGVPPERRPVNMVFQRYALFPHRNVIENVMFGLESARVPRPSALARAREALATCNIENLETRRISELSGGQAQRVAVARALVNRPKILLLDEPLAALDVKLRRHLRFELRRLQQELETTFLYVTHDQGEALAMSDSIVLMNGGRVIQHSSSRELYDAPNCVFAATFIGEANVLSCTVRSVAQDVAEVVIDGITMRASARGPVPEGTQAHLYVRPERVALRQGGEGADLQVTVTDAAFEGGIVRYWLTVRDTQIELVAETMVRAGDAIFPPGASLQASWEAGEAHVLLE